MQREQCSIGVIVAVVVVACGGTARSAGQQASGGAAGLGMHAGGGGASGEATSAGATVGGTAGADALGRAGSAGASASAGSVSGGAGSSGGQGTGGAGEGGAAGSPADCPQVLDEQCLSDRKMRLGPPSVVDDDGDGLIEPGETIVIHSELQNPGPDNHNIYPGVAFTVSHPGVQPASGGWHGLFGMLAGDSEPFELSFELPSAVAAGTLIAITLVPSGLNPHIACTCQHAIVVELVID